jgi:hypothetical protein
MPLKAPGDTGDVQICCDNEIGAHLPDVLEGTGVGLRPGIHGQSGAVLLQPCGFGLESVAMLCVDVHDASLSAVVFRAHGPQYVLIISGKLCWSLEIRSNASLQLLPEAGATQERRL